VTLHSNRHKTKGKGHARDCTRTEATERQTLHADQLSWCQTIYQTKWDFRSITL